MAGVSDVFGHVVSRLIHFRINFFLGLCIVISLTTCIMIWWGTWDIEYNPVPDQVQPEGRVRNPRAGPVIGHRHKVIDKLINGAKWVALKDYLIEEIEALEQMKPKSNPHFDFGGEENIRKSDKPPIYMITPTYPRPLQIAELTRIAHVLKAVDNVIWIVAEDAFEPTRQVLQFLQEMNLPYKYLLSPMPTEHRKKEYKMWPKGVSNRNAGLQWIFEHVRDTGDDSGIIYFADDDNSYDARLFEEIRKTKRVSMFPVGLMSGLFVSTPILEKNTGKFSGFYEGWVGDRQYAVDMAGFAVSVRQYITKSGDAPILMAFHKGYEEESFLKAMGVPIHDVEFLAENCTKIYVYHTKTIAPEFFSFKNINLTRHRNTNLGALNQYWCLYLGDKPCGSRWKKMQSSSQSGKNAKINSKNAAAAPKPKPKPKPLPQSNLEKS